MKPFDFLLPVDNDNNSLQDSWGIPVEKTMTFAGGTTNDPGDYDGTGNPATLFTVTGSVRFRLVAVCTTVLAGASATLEVGTTKSTANIIAQTTATDIDADEIWHDNAPDNNVETAATIVENVLGGGQDIIQTVATANITSGVILYIVRYFSLSKDGKVIPA